MSSRTIGWLFVGCQAVLLIAIVLLPNGSAWAQPAWLRAVAMALIVVGLAIIAFASLRLGSALTPTPVPTSSGQLVTGGLYRHVRHPIYTGVLSIVVGLAIRSGSWVTVAVAAVTIGFFHVKASWEESKLEEAYPAYAAYASVTPRFAPRLRPRR